MTCPGKNLRLLAAVLAGWLLLAIPRTAMAHPHVWIDCEVSPVFDEKGLAGFREHWFFDEMFSTNIVAEALGKLKEPLSEADQKAIKAYGFDNLKEFRYFNDIRIDGHAFEVKFVKDFKCSFQDGMLAYSFFVPCHVTAVSTPKKIVIGVYDATYYSNIYSSQCTPDATSAGSSMAVSCRETELTGTTLDVVYQPPRGYSVEFHLR